MMMNLCILSLLIEDVVAMGGATAKAAGKLLGEKKTNPEPKVPAVVTKAPKKMPEVPDVPDVTEAPVKEPEVTEAPVKAEEVAPDGAEEEISCGGHTAGSCAACLDHTNAPDDHTAASYCNGDCVVEISDKGDISCVKHNGPHVDCGFHQAETCKKCTNLAVGQGRFCNGSCEMNDNGVCIEMTMDL